MAKASAFACDGPKCSTLVARTPGQRGAPENFLRLTLHTPGDEDKIDAAFCDPACLQAWIDDQFDVADLHPKSTPAPVVRSGQE
jgi:hypothetical protein